MRFDTVLELETIGRAGAKLVEDEYGQRARYLSSFWLYVERDDQAFTPHWPTGYWESWVSCWLSKQWDKFDTFVDIGANVGYFTMQAAKAGVERVIAIEPNPRLADMLYETRRVNKVIRNVDVWSQAVSNYSGNATLWVPEGHSGGASLRDAAEGFEVIVTRFDEAYISWDRSNRMLFKIDAEGEEPKIWDGMKRTLARHECEVLLEWHGVRYDRHAFAAELAKHNLWWIDYSGNEIPINEQWLIDTDELVMVLVRPNKEALNG